MKRKLFTITINEEVLERLAKEARYVPPSLLDIGDDCMIQVISYMDSQTWLKFSYVCKYMNGFKYNEYAVSNKLMQQYNLLEDFMETDDDTQYNTLEQFMKSDKDTHFNIYLRMNQPKVFDSVFKHFGDRLHSLELDFYDDEYPTELLYISNMKNLRSLCLRGTNLNTKFFESLEKLDLKSLKLSRSCLIPCSVYTNESFLSLISRLDVLHITIPSIILSFLSHVKSGIKSLVLYSELFSHRANLIYLKSKYIKNIKIYGKHTHELKLDNYFQYFDGVKELYLSDVTIDTMKYIPQNIEKITLDDCMMMASLIRTFTHPIKELNIIHIDNSEFQDKLVEIAAKCNNIKLLRFEE